MKKFRKLTINSVPILVNKKSAEWYCLGDVDDETI